MTSDHVRNALILIFIFNMVLMAQNWRESNRLEATLAVTKANTEEWTSRWEEMKKFMKDHHDGMTCTKPKGEAK